MFPGVRPCAACALLESDDTQFVAECRLCLAQLGGGTSCRLVQAQSSLDADHQQIENVGQALSDFSLPVGDLASEPEVRHQEAESERQAQEEERAEVKQAGGPADKEQEEGH